MYLTYLPVVVMLVGAVIWLATDHAKVAEAGRLMFFAGLFISLLAWAR